MIDKAKVPVELFCNEDITPQAIAIYAFYSLFADEDGFVDADELSKNFHMLKMGSSAFYGHRRHLENGGFIEISKVREKGIIQGNRIRLVPLDAGNK